MRVWLSGKASPSQGEDREFESRHPLQKRLAGALVPDKLFGDDTR